MKVFAVGLLSLTSSVAVLSGQRSPVDATVPFVGCASDGQVGPLAAPSGKPHPVLLRPALAAKLAWYKAEDGPGILAPRGWYCFSTYGSNGSSLFISPEPIDSKQFFSDTWHGFTGPVIQSSSMVGDTSGRFSVAGTIARVFPAHRQFVENVIAEGLRPASDFPTGPYPRDTLYYKSEELVEFTTPANTDGLGTDSRLVKNGFPIHGFAMLAGDTPDCITVALRLQPGQDDLIPAILTTAERDFAISEKP